MTAPLEQLLQHGDLDELVREVDRYSRREDWRTVQLIRERCLAAAADVGRQLWGVAQYAEYRLALEAPAAIAAAVVTPGAARFTLGPLTEVVAQQHTWTELADHLGPGVAGTVAQERVLRGEDVTGDARAAAGDTGMPGRLQPWEPAYPLPVYRPDELLENGPAARGRWLPVDAATGTRRDLGRLTGALDDLASVWTEQSTGTAREAAVDGDAGAAVAAVAGPGGRLSRISVADAFAAMAWAAASGGAHGRRAGMAAGRSAAWWVGHAATGLDWPADPDELEYRLEDLGWYLFEPATDDHGSAAGPSAGGWRLRLVIENRAAGWSAAIDARDDRVTETSPQAPAGGRPDASVSL